MASKFELLIPKWDTGIQQTLSQTKILQLERKSIEKSDKENNHTLIYQLASISHRPSHFDYRQPVSLVISIPHTPLSFI